MFGYEREGVPALKKAQNLRVAGRSRLGISAAKLARHVSAGPDKREFQPRVTRVHPAQWRKTTRLHKLLSLCQFCRRWIKPWIVKHLKRWSTTLVGNVGPRTVL